MTEIPTFRSFSFILCTAAWMSPSASQWTVMASHPASAKASMYLTGSSIIRWASKNPSEYPLTALITGGPNVMLGTNIPSITSRWIQSAPALSVLAISSPSLEKSADRIEGDTLVIGVLMGPVDNSAFASVPITGRVLSVSVGLEVLRAVRMYSVVGRSIIIAVSQSIFRWAIRSIGVWHRLEVWRTYHVCRYGG